MSQQQPRTSVTFPEVDVERAMAAEFGWGSGGRGTVDRSDSVVGSGVVVSARARPAAAAVDRKKSWGSERGLVSVPEEGIEDDDDHAGGGGDGDDNYHSSPGSAAGSPGRRHRRMPSDDDQAVLLGHRRNIGNGGTGELEA